MAKVLVVDDEPFIVRMLRDKLQNVGISVVSATNGREAVVVAEEENPQVIVLDWMMPEMNGIDACKAIRTLPAHRRTPIIMLTAKGQELDEQKGRDAGADYYVTKPFSPRLLLRLVEDCLDT